MQRSARETRAARMAASALAGAVVAFVGACAPSPSAQYSEALAAWESRQYSKALVGAKSACEAASKANDAPIREQSAYLAGLAAFQMGRLEEAASNLTIAAASSSALLAGRATAMLGGVALEQGRWSDAAALYSKAAGMLQGKEADGARAKALEMEARAKSLRQVNGAQANPRTDGGSRPQAPLGAFTIVAGTFSSEVAARQRASTLVEPARRAGLGAPRVVGAAAPDRRIWLVEVGTFGERSKAEAALKQLPVTDGRIAPPQAR